MSELDTGGPNWFNGIMETVRSAWLTLGGTMEPVMPLYTVGDQVMVCGWRHTVLEVERGPSWTVRVPEPASPRDEPQGRRYIPAGYTLNWIWPKRIRDRVAAGTLSDLPEIRGWSMCETDIDGYYIP